MKLGRKIVVGYLVAVGVAFFAGYFLFGIRELGLYVLLMAINLPASFVIVPGMENVSLALGWVLGAPVHVYATQIFCMAANGALLTALVRLVQQLRRSDTRGKGRVV